MHYANLFQSTIRSVAASRAWLVGKRRRSVHLSANDGDNIAATWQEPANMEGSGLICRHAKRRPVLESCKIVAQNHTDWDGSRDLEQDRRRD